MDFSRGVSNQEDRDKKIHGSWIPIIPEKPIPRRPEQITDNRQANQSGITNRHESDRSVEFFQEIPSIFNGDAKYLDLMSSLDQSRGVSNWEAALAEKRCSNHIVGPYTPSLQNVTGGWNNNNPFAASASEMQRGSNNATGGPYSPISYTYSHIDNCWHQRNSENMTLVTQNYSNNESNPRNNNYCPSQINQYGFHVPYHSPRGIADAVSNGTISFQFAPITPEKGERVDNNQSSKMVNVSVDERLIHDDINSKGNNALELQCKESFLQTVVDSSSGTIFNTPLEENRNPEKGEENGIGLNKTPEQKAKRKKHRPRVVREGKPKRTPKATIGRTSTKETPAVKRKYVRKKVSNTPADIVGEATDPAHTTAVKSCKRALNFNLEGQAADARHETLIHQEGMLHCNVDGSSSRLASSFNSESRDTDLSTVVPNSSSGAKTTVQLPQGIKVMVENSQAGFAFDLNRATTQTLDDYISLPEKPAPTTPPPTRKDPPREAPGHQHIHAVGTGDALCTGNSYTNNENAVPSMLQNSVRLISKSQDNTNCSQHYKVADGEQAKGPKRGYCHTTETDERQLQSMNMMRANLNSMLVYQAICRENGYHGNDSNLDPHFPEIYKKRRTEKAKNAVLLSTSSGMANVGDDAGKATAQSENNANADHFASQANNNGSASQFNNADGTKNLNHGASYSDIYSQSEAAGPNRQVQGIPAEMLSHKEALSRASLGILQAPNFIQTFGHTERKTKRRSKGPTRVHNLASPTANAEHNTCPSTPMKMATSGDRQGIEIFHGPQACVEALAAVDNHAKMAKKKRSKKLSIDTSVAYLCTDKVNLQENETPIYIYQQALAKSRGPSKVAWPFNAHIEEIIQRFNRLNINGESNKILVEEQNALVPFGGHGQMIPFAGNGQMVLFEGQFYPIKKRKPRPKVDLDAESERVWKLLMGKESINDVEGTDEDKEKWWEEERRVFRGRADSFIARMHLIQGDRRFTHWKGSVLDSVVGVFLTQNVSDHLSSSAYMSLAAKFPLKPQSNNENGTNMYVEEPEECILDSNDTIKWHKDISREPVGDQGSVTFQEAEHVEERQMSNSHESFGSNTGGGSSPDISKSMQLDICESGQKMCHELTQNRTDNMTTGEGCKSFSEVENVALEDVGSSPSSDVSSQNSEDSILQKDDRTVIPKMGSANPIDTLDMRALNDASLNSSNSSTLQTSVRIRSCSDSSSEPEDPTKSCKPNILNASFTELLQMAGATMSQEFYNNTSDSPSLNLNSKNGHNQSEDTETDKRSNLETINGLKDLLSIHPSISQTTLVGVPIIPSSNDYLQVTPNSGALGVECPDVLGGESRFSLPSIASGITEIRDVDCTSKRTGQVAASASETTAQQKLPSSAQAAPTANTYSSSSNQTVPLLINLGHEACSAKQPLPQKTKSTIQAADSNLPNFPGETLHVVESMSSVEKQKSVENKVAEPNLTEQVHSSEKASHGTTTKTSTSKAKLEREKKKAIDWDNLRKVYSNGAKRERSNDKMDSVDWEAVRCADVHKIAETIKERGMNNMLAERIKAFLNRIVTDHGSIDLEWLRDIPPDKAKEYLLSVRGLGLKSVECVRLLTLHHLAFPVDTNVGRIAVRLGWVPLQPLPESLQLHLLELYPMQETIQKYLWPRLCTLDQRTLYELHYQMITFGKVFCTKSKPNCNACPMRAECKHFASAFASARLALPGPEEKGIVSSTVPTVTNQNPAVNINPMPLPQLEANQISEERPKINKSEPLIEQPATPEPESIEMLENDIEDALYEDPDEIPTISLNIEEFALNLQNYMQENMELQEGDMSKALIALTPEATSIPMPKLKNMSRLRTEHQVYELPDSHPLLKGVDRRVAGDICSYLLAIWTPGETAESTQPPERCCSSQISGDLCNEKTCFSCSSIREANSQTVRGTLLIPCKTAMKGSFPLNGTYFQVNEVFADHDSSLNPIDVPRAWIWNLPRRTVLFGTSIPTIFKGQSTEEIQSCFWKGYVCIRGFDQKTRAPRPLMARFHFPASKLVRSKTQTNQ